MKIHSFIQTFADYFFSGEKPSYFLSINGNVNEYRFFNISAIFASLYLLAQIISPLLMYCMDVFLFYFILILIQKRCRDFGNSGTWWILAYSAATILYSATYFVLPEERDSWLKYCGYITAALYLFILPLFIIPSKPDADINLTSPLMKHPVIYTAVCFVLCIAATWTVNHYYGINIELF